jgi:hypothetical protein
MAGECRMAGIRSGVLRISIRLCASLALPFPSHSLSSLSRPACAPESGKEWEWDSPLHFTSVVAGAA